MKTIKKIKTGILLTGALTACALYGDEYLTIDYGEGPVARIKHDGKPIKCRVDDDDLEPRDFEYLFNGNILCAVVVKSDERFWVHIMDKTVSSSLKREMQKGADVIDFQSDRIAFLGKTRMANTFYAFGTKETTTAGISEDSKTELILRKKAKRIKFMI
jgi:hypothetical protein